MRWFSCLLVASIAAPGLMTASPGGEKLAPATFVGRLVNQHDEPVAGAVTLVATGLSLTAFAGSDGRFRLENVPVDEVLKRSYGGRTQPGLLFAGPHVAPGTVPIPVLFPGREHDLGEIVLDEGTSIAGRILLPDGSPAKEATVTTSSLIRFMGNTTLPFFPGGSTRTDAEGRFVIEHLPATETDLDVILDGYQRVHRAIADDAELSGIVLKDMKLKPEFPVRGSVHDEHGNPVAGATAQTWLGMTKVDDLGRFELHGLAPNYSVQLAVFAEGRQRHLQLHQGESLLDITLAKPKGIRFRLTDADSGRPIKPQQMVLCTYSRNDDGETVLNGCRSVTFTTSEDGHVEAEHWGPHAYHVLVRSEGYEVFEKYLDPLDGDESVDLGTVTLHRGDAEAEIAATQEIHGRFLGETVKGALASLWWEKPNAIRDQVNCPLSFGRTVPQLAYCYEVGVVGRDGSFALNVPYQGEWYVRVDVPDCPPTIHGPVTVGLKSIVDVSVAISLGGGIQGAVDDPNGTVNKSGLWAIAFDRGFVRRMTRVKTDGTFEFAHVPVGDYGVKLGRLGFKDREVEFGRPPADSPAWTTPADPWLRATKCRVEADQIAQVKVRWSKN